MQTVCPPPFRSVAPEALAYLNSMFTPGQRIRLKTVQEIVCYNRNVLSLSLERCSGHREEAIVKGLLIPDRVSGCIGE
jgi:hypothetical protein